MLLVVGLGNPGPRYAPTRHNAGFMVIDELAQRSQAKLRAKFDAEFGDGRAGGEPCLLLKPQTYMNDSGRSVRAAATFYKVPLEGVVVIHDELDLPFATLKLKQGGGDAGHRGLKSVTAHLGSGNYLRLRFGIGRPPPEFRGSPADFVLEAFASAEKAELSALVKSAADAVESVVSHGLAAAMNEVNRRMVR